MQIGARRHAAQQARDECAAGSGGACDGASSATDRGNRCARRPATPAPACAPALRPHRAGPGADCSEPRASICCSSAPTPGGWTSMPRKSVSGRACAIAAVAAPMPKPISSTTGAVRPKIVGQIDRLFAVGNHVARRQFLQRPDLARGPCGRRAPHSCGCCAAAGNRRILVKSGGLQSPAVRTRPIAYRRQSAYAGFFAGAALCPSAIGHVLQPFCFAG